MGLLQRPKSGNFRKRSFLEAYASNRKMKLVVHRGTHQIGGSCVEVFTSSTRIIVDLGLPLDSADSQLDVPGLFSPGPKVDAIFLSHAHMDHCGLLEKARREIPVYLSKGTSKMLLAGSLFAKQRTGRDRKTVEVKAGKTYAVGDIRVTPLAVDHSAFDAMAFLVEADGKRLLYSGDLRLHGRKPGMARELVRAATKEPLDCLVMEGTNLGTGRESGMCEGELENHLADRMGAATGLVFGAFSPMHVDRLVTFYKAALRSRRTFVLDAYGAFVLHLASGQARIPRPTARNRVRVFYNESFRRMRRRFESSELISGKPVPKLHSLFDNSQIELGEIINNPSKYLMLFRPSMVARDFGGQLPAKSTCFYSYWRGYLDEPEWHCAQKEIAASGGKLIEAHTSGHIFCEHIENFVRALKPAMVVPIHTTGANWFAERFSNTVSIRDGSEVVLKDL